MGRHRFIVVLLLALAAMLPLFDLLHPGLSLTHDGKDHVARIANFYASLGEGHAVPRWAENLNWGFGHPILMFLYPLPSYIASLFHFLGFSLVDSVKLVFAFSFVAAAATMYLFGSFLWGAYGGVLASVVYSFAPYRFVDLYVRGAIGEHVAFIFPPLILWALTHVARQPRKVTWALVSGIAMAGFILSHNAISIMFLPPIFLYALYLYVFEVKEKLSFALYFVGIIVLGFSLSAFFWLPAFFEGKYTLRDIVTAGEFSGRFVPWQWFFVSPWNYGGGNQFTKSVGIAQWLVVAVAIILLGKKTPLRWLTMGTLVTFLVTLFLMTAPSEPVWNTIKIMQKFQFPWRLLTLSVFCTAVIAGTTARLVAKRFLPLWVGAVILLSVVSTRSMWHAVSYVVRTESYYTGIYNGTTDTGESSPIWSVRFMEHRPDAPLEIVNGAAKINQIQRTSTLHRYIVQADARTRLVENTLYFPGWSVLVDGQATLIEFQDPAFRGLMTFWLEPGVREVVVRFSETKMRLFADSVSTITLVVVFGIVTISVWRRKT